MKMYMKMHEKKKSFTSALLSLLKKWLLRNLFLPYVKEVPLHALIT